LTTRVWPLPAFGRVGGLAWDQSIRATGQLRGGTYVDVDGRYDLLVRQPPTASNVLTWKQVVWCAGVPFFVYADHEAGGKYGDGGNDTVTAALRPRLVKAATLHFQNGAKHHMPAYVPDVPSVAAAAAEAAAAAAATATAAAAAAAAPAARVAATRAVPRGWRRGWPRALAAALSPWRDVRVTAAELRAAPLCVCRGAPCRSCRPVEAWLRTVAHSGPLREQLRRSC